ncbi:MAG: ABC transporter ATP-binding protein [Candidatus Delongbacteria bacterium]|nr:ABC transporter ATP-binding protein [Candidatus Delongbacteria bacterium]
MSEISVELSKIDKKYSDKSVLSALDLKIKKSAVTSVIGPNGSGKTTLFKIILSITDPDNGHILADKEMKTGFLIEDLRPYENLNLMQNLAAFSLLEGKHVSASDAEDIITMSFCKDICRKPIKKLSAGQKRKAYFAFSLLSDPDLIILDEPLNSLDLKERIDLISSIKYLRDSRSKTIVISSHDLDSLYEICDTFCFLKDGRIERIMDKKEIAQSELNSIFMELYG